MQDAAERERAITAALALVLLLLVCCIAIFVVRIRRKNSLMNHEAEEMKRKLWEINVHLAENKKKADKYRQYSERYQELLIRQKSIEDTLVAQLVADRTKCIDAFKRSAFDKKLPALLENGDAILRVAKREEMQKAIDKDFMLL